MEIPPEIKNRTTIQSSNSTSGYLSEENENIHLKRYMHPHVHCNIIYNSQVNGNNLSFHGWMNG